MIFLSISISISGTLLTVVLLPALSSRLTDINPSAVVRAVRNQPPLTVAGSEFVDGSAGQTRVYGTMYNVGGLSLDEAQTRFPFEAPLAVGAGYVALDVQGYENVTITDIRAKIYVRGLPVSGTLVYGPAQGSGEVLNVGIDGDTQDAPARVVKDEFGLESNYLQIATLGAPYFRHKTITLGPGEYQRVVVLTQSRRSFLEYSLMLTYQSGGRSHSVEVFNTNSGRGKHFYVTASLPFSGYQSVWAVPFADLPAGWQDPATYKGWN